MSTDAVEVHVHLHFPPDPRIEQILTAITALKTQGDEVALDLTKLTAAAAANQNAEQSAILLMQQLGAELTAAINGGDQDAVNAVADALNNESATLSAAVVANTPAAPPASDTPPADTSTPAAPADGGLSTGTVTGTDSSGASVDVPGTGTPPAAV